MQIREHQTIVHRLAKDDVIGVQIGIFGSELEFWHPKWNFGAGIGISGYGNGFQMQQHIIRAIQLFVRITVTVTQILP